MLSLNRAFWARLWVVLGAMAAAGAGGCSWFGWGGSGPADPEARGRAFVRNHEDYAELGYRLDWTGFPVVTVKRNPITIVAAYDDALVTLERGSNVSVLETSTGARRWARELANPLTRFVGVYRDGAALYCASESDLFVLSMDTGTMLARERIEKVVSTAPIPYGRLAIFGTPMGELLAHITGVSVKLWGNAVRGALESDPVLIGDVVGAVSQAGDILFVNAADGMMVGRNRIFGGLSTNPVASDRYMYVASEDQSIYAFDPNGGRALWRHKTAVPLRQQPTYHAGVLYCAIEGEGLLALNAETGDVLWTAPDLRGTVIGVRAGRLILWDGRTATTLGPDRGDVIDRITLPNVAMLKMDAFEDGTMYAISDQGVVARYVPKF